MRPIAEPPTERDGSTEGVASTCSKGTVDQRIALVPDTDADRSNHLEAVALIEFLEV